MTSTGMEIFLQFESKRTIPSKDCENASDLDRAKQAKWELTSARLTGLMDEGTRYLQGGGLLTGWLTLSTSFI